MLKQGVKDNRIITIDRREFPVKKGHHRQALASSPAWSLRAVQKPLLEGKGQGYERL